MIRKIALVITISLFSLLPLFSVFSQDNISDVQTNTISGEILRKDSNKLTIKTNDNTKEMQISQGVKITKNTSLSNIDDLQPGDRVEVKVGENGEILEVNATSGQIFNVGSWLVPLLILTAIILVLIIYFLRRSKKDFIRTSVTKIK